MAAQLRTVYDGANPYADFGGTGSLTTRYLADPRTPDALFARVAADGTTAWYLRDNINSVRQVVGPTGAVLDQLSYDSFGNVLSETNPAGGDRFKYTGREYDPELGIYYYRARYYDPATGRFLGEDPLGIGAGDPNFYRYVGNQPTGRIDPSGLEPPKFGPEPGVIEYPIPIVVVSEPIWWQRTGRFGGTWTRYGPSAGVDAFPPRVWVAPLGGIGWVGPRGIVGVGIRPNVGFPPPFFDPGYHGSLDLPRLRGPDTTPGNPLKTGGS